MRLILVLLAALIAAPALAQDAPSGISVKPLVNGLSEGVKVGDGIKIADLGVNWPEGVEPTPVTFTLGGKDGSSFELRKGGEVWFIAGTPDYETKNAYSVSITASTEGNEDVTAGYTLPIFDVREATLAYRYDPDSKLYLQPEQVPTGKGGELLVGKNTTLVKPAQPSEGMWPKFDPETEEWSEVDLHVGKTIYATANKSEKTVGPDNVIPEGYTLTAPTSEWDEWDEATSSWVENTNKKDAAAELIGRIRDLTEDPDTVAVEDRLSNATPAQIEAYVSNKFQNINDLASAKLIIGKLFVEMLKREASQAQKEAAE